MRLLESQGLTEAYGHVALTLGMYGHQLAAQMACLYQALF
jgi:hypothetical protein